MYKKIDIFADGKYVFSTNDSKTCKAAVERVLECIEKHPASYGFLKGKKLTALFDKSRK